MNALLWIWSLQAYCCCLSTNKVWRTSGLLWNFHSVNGLNLVFIRAKSGIQSDKSYNDFRRRPDIIQAGCSTFLSESQVGANNCHSTASAMKAWKWPSGTSRRAPQGVPLSSGLCLHFCIIWNHLYHFVFFCVLSLWNSFTRWHTVLRVSS